MCTQSLLMVRMESIFVCVCKNTYSWLSFDWIRQQSILLEVKCTEVQWVEHFVCRLGQIKDLFHWTSVCAVQKNFKLKASHLQKLPSKDFFFSVVYFSRQRVVSQKEAEIHKILQTRSLTVSPQLLFPSMLTRSYSSFDAGKAKQAVTIISFLEFGKKYNLTGKNFSPLTAQLVQHLSQIQPNNAQHTQRHSAILHSSIRDLQLPHSWLCSGKCHSAVYCENPAEWSKKQQLC